MGVSNLIFLLVFLAAVGWFATNCRKVIRNVKLGKPLDRSDKKSERLKLLINVALGQSKMVKRPISGFLHLVVYVGFVIINIEVIEILIDGVSGSHRALSFLGPFYDVLIAAFEWLALGVILACVVFLIRRNVLKLARFHMREMKLWPKSDANIILFFEIVLMSAFLTMNGADALLQERAFAHYETSGLFPVSTWMMPWLDGFSNTTLVAIERTAWWLHIVGIFLFLNYLPYSKHFHIMLAFPNVYFSDLSPKGSFNNLESVKKEVQLMMDPSADPYAAPAGDTAQEPERFGAKDVQDLTWKNLLDAYTCTECGRCTSVCPANQTGKLLSPRKIMMDTRDRLEEVGAQLKGKQNKVEDGKALLGDYILEEEVWACTTCNACVEACPVNIDPLSIIVDLRRYLVMEESKASGEIATMLSNIENNGAPWQFAQADRLKWAEDDQ